MRVSDDRCTRDRQRLDPALRLIRHEARTFTIRRWKGAALPQAILLTAGKKPARLRVSHGLWWRFIVPCSHWHWTGRHRS